VDDLGPSLDSKIAFLTQEKALPPLVRLAFEGSVAKNETALLAKKMPSNVQYAADIRIEAESKVPGEQPRSGLNNKSPLEFFRFQARDRLEDWEYLAGVRFRMDFEIAHRPSGGVADASRAALFMTERLAKDIRDGIGRNRKGASRNQSPGDISVSRLDAMRRRGELAKRCLVSFWLAEKIIGEEHWPKDVAAYLHEDVRYIGPRFREALAVLAGYYRLNERSTSRAGMQAYHNEDADVAEAV
jgi:hypothetical protein